MILSFRNLAEHTYQNQQPQQYHRVEMIISQNCNTPPSNISSHRHHYTPNTESLEIENRNIVVAHPRQQHQRSRSLSEVWLEHRRSIGCRSIRVSSLLQINSRPERARRYRECFADNPDCPSLSTAAV